MREKTSGASRRNATSAVGNIVSIIIIIHRYCSGSIRLMGDCSRFAYETHVDIMQMNKTIKPAGFITVVRDHFASISIVADTFFETF